MKEMKEMGGIGVVKVIGLMGRSWRPHGLRCRCRGLRWVLVVLAALVVMGCAEPGREVGLSVASYNVQTLFDDRLDGGEFAEFVPSADGWNSKKYHNRLRQFSRVIRDLVEGAPDILVLQEVENAQVIRDMDRYFIRDLNYRHVVVSEPEGLALAVLSRREFLESRIHGVRWEERAIRPMVEVHVEVDAGRRLILYAVHWKSKREGAAETEELRRASAHALVRSIMDNKITYPEALFLVAGDFNEDINEFAHQQGEYQTALMPALEITNWLAESAGARAGSDSGGADGIGGEELFPLFVADGRENASGLHDWAGGEIPLLYHLWKEGEGSYYFRGRWERIDQILFSGEFFKAYNQIHFWVGDAWYLLDSSLRPRRYMPRTASGYSDHLPIVFDFSLE